MIIHVGHVSHAFARQFVLSTAPSGDRELGSGPLGDDPWRMILNEDEFPSSRVRLCRAAPGCLEQSFLLLSSGVRYGEADHPGPKETQSISLGVTNPSGLRMKESIAIEMGEGIYTFCETQLSKFTQASCGKRLRGLAMESDRLVRTHFSAPAPVRATSTWAGSWTGIATVSDFPSRVVTLPWPQDLYQTGRVLVSQHFIHSVPLLVAGVYGFARSPTWPNASELTEKLLSVLTAEILYGASGPRAICGDFNASSDSLQAFQCWRMMGWRSVQEWAAQKWGQEIKPTCKGSSEVDMIWLSPEALAMCDAVAVHDHFAEHATVVATLRVPCQASSVRHWPTPSRIPWPKVDQSWPTVTAKPLDVAGTSDLMYSKWASDFEESLVGHIPTQPEGSLIPNQCGRARHRHPLEGGQNGRLLKRSRPGEAEVRSDFLGSATKRWFQQLRRLQSYKHSALAGKHSVNAQVYRAELWTSIRRARGFVPDFPSWWASHVEDVGCGCPVMLPEGPPDGETAVALFVEFKVHYEKFEAWHLRQRSQLLKAKHDRTMKALHRDLAAPFKQQVDLFWDTFEYQILEADENTHQLLLDRPLRMQGCSRWFLDEVPVTVLSDHSDVCTVEPFPQIGPDSVLVQKQTVAQLNDVQEQLLEFWKQRWLALPPFDDELWQRIVSFLQAYVPQLAFHVPELEVKDWQKAVKRFGLKAATGVGGVSAEDLKHMPHSWIQQLLEILKGVETNKWDWPCQMTFGRPLS